MAARPRSPRYTRRDQTAFVYIFCARQMLVFALREKEEVLPLYTPDHRFKNVDCASRSTAPLCAARRATASETRRPARTRVCLDGNRPSFFFEGRDVATHRRRAAGRGGGAAAPRVPQEAPRRAHHAQVERWRDLQSHLFLSLSKTGRGSAGRLRRCVSLGDRWSSPESLRARKCPGGITEASLDRK